MMMLLDLKPYFFVFSTSQTRIASDSVKLRNITPSDPDARHFFHVAMLSSPQPALSVALQKTEGARMHRLKMDAAGVPE
jgi:hypothetical protein